MKLFQAFVGAILLLCLCSVSAQTESVQWSQFRGPNGSVVSDGCKPPLKIIANEMAWKTAMPPGKSSPVLWEDRIFLTGVENERLVTLALDKQTGTILWKRLAPEVPL